MKTILNTFAAFLLLCGLANAQTGYSAGSSGGGGGIDATTPRAANFVLAGPPSGAAAAPTFRAVTTPDILVSTLKITYTGSPQTPFILPVCPTAIVPVGTVSGQATYKADKFSIISFTYAEGNLTIGNVLLTLSFDDLVAVGGAFTPTNMASLTNLSLPTLTTVGGAFSPATMAGLTTLNIPALTTVGGAFSPATMASLTTFNVSALTSVGGSFTPSAMSVLTTLSFDSLTTVGGTFSPNTLAALTTLNTPILTTVGGSFSPSSMATLTTVSAPAMVTYGGIITVPSGTMANVTSVTLGTVGTLKTITGATINVSGLKLPSANVNAILALLVSLDGTNGTTLWGAGKTLTINGGTNGAPTGQGITDKATLVARTATVTTN